MKTEQLRMNKWSKSARRQWQHLHPPAHRSLFVVRSSLFILFLALATPAAAFAQQPTAEPPLAGRPLQFSNIVGAYAMAVHAEPTEVPLEEPITLTITITGQGPAKYQPRRKDLKLFPERWLKDFYVEPVPSADRYRAEANTWEFVWRLRPRHQQVTAIDGIKLLYYQPASNGAAGRYQTARADAIEIKVGPRRPAQALPEHVPVRTAPASFYALPPARAMLASQPLLTSWPAWILAIFVVVPPLLTMAGARAWRWLAPTGPRRRVHEHSRAARRALQSLGSTDGEPAWIVVGHYLRERLEFPAEEPTPAEVRRFVRKRGTSRPVADKLAVFLGSCDSARFAGPGVAGAGELREQAARLIRAMEDDLCTP
jgi:hypothetical protein